MSEQEEYPALPTRAETPQEKAMYEWFAEQRFKSADNLEAAARQIITLCTSLLGLLLGLLALAGSTVPAYMQWSGVRWLGGIGVVLLLLALLAGLGVVVPWRMSLNLQDGQALNEAWQKLLARKSQKLWVALIAFASGMVCLTLLIILALTL